jgi:hypothetical protein
MRGIILTIMSLTGLYAQNYPYKPKPILFIHGRSGSSETWGVYPEEHFIEVGFPPKRYKNPSSDTIIKDSIIPGHTYDRFLPIMEPYCYVWDEIDGSYTKPDDEGYPNKSFLEVWNADYPLGSIDEESWGYFFLGCVLLNGKEV